MIELQGVVVELDGERVLGPVSLVLEQGALLGLIGPPGSGKSLLLKVIAGLVRPSTGAVRVLGEDLGKLSEERLRRLRRSIGMVFQNNALFDSRTIFENVAFPLRRSDRGYSEDQLRARVTERLAGVGLTKSEALYPHELSGGMQKRAGIARATADDPPVRLYDEPTAGLDPVTSARILSLVTAIHARVPGVSIIISNEMDTLLPVVPRLVMMNRGGIVYDGPKARLMGVAEAGGEAPGRPGGSTEPLELARRFVAGDVSVEL